ncbi:MAG TPA: glutathione S-transferase family protein [Gaiellaceae bacterium]|nr:glutathione S-transferase family protein [Gaiellaceae bacterium]
MRAWGIPWSTNCERVSIAAALADVDVEWTLVTFDDRTLIEELSGQKGVPIAELDGKIVVGSLAIVGRIAPQLWPDDPRERALVDTFLEWFDRIWLHPLGVLWRDQDEERKARAAKRLDRSLERFEALLEGDYLFGELSVADVAAYPFLKYATDTNPDDDYDIHDIMRRSLSVEGRPRIAAWLERVAALPFARLV